MTALQFHDKLLASVARWNMLPPGIHIGVAVSGGADSVALVCALHSLAESFSWKLSVLHVNHKLRGAESDDDAYFVQELSRRLGLFLQIADLPVNQSGNLEQEARNARYQWFRDCAASGNDAQLRANLRRVALGHTLSDQAETVMFRFLRGSGTAGLSGIRPVLDNFFVRPLLEISRDDVRAYLRAIGQNWREDSSNQNSAFDRNRIRLELLPEIAQKWNPRIETTLASVGEWARAEEEYWEQIISGLAALNFQKAPRGAQICAISAFRDLPLASVRRLIRRAILLVRGDLHSIDFDHVEQIRTLTTQADGSGRMQVPGVDVIRSFDWVRFASPDSYRGDRFFSVPAEWPGFVALPESNSRLLLQVENADNGYNATVDCLDAHRFSGPLRLRTWQPGDQYRLLGSDSPVKLKSLFQDARIPIWERRTWPVLITGSPDLTNSQSGGDVDSIVWSRRFGAAAAYAADSRTRQVLRIVEQG